MKKLLFFLYIYFSFFQSSSIIASEEHSLVPANIGIKCGTPHIMANMIPGIAKIALRSTMDTSVVSSLNHFRVHYDTTGLHAPEMTDKDANGIPDYVDSTLVYLEYAWDIIINQLGYSEPLRDSGHGGGDEIDVYLKDLASDDRGLYGQTFPDTYIGNSASSYIEIENDFKESVFSTKGYDALRVTTAHEFFHTIHFSYYYNPDIIWWMEHTAVWMEDRVWDDVNDYLTYIKLFFNNNQKPLDGNGDFMYGAAIWAFYLANRFGDGIIKDIWENIRTLHTTSIASFDDVIPIGLPAALGEFSVWNYFTKDNANSTDFYPDSHLFNYTIDPDVSANKSPAQESLTIKYLTSRYAELLFVGEYAELDTLRVNVTPLDAGTYVNNMIFYNNPYDYRINTVNQEGEDILLDGIWKKAILVTTCTSTSGNNYNYSFDIEMIEEMIPAIMVLNPSEGTSLTAGVPVSIIWETGDQVDESATFDVNISFDGVNFAAIDTMHSVGLPAGTESYGWTPDTADFGNVWIQIMASDGNQATLNYNVVPAAFAVLGIYPNPFNTSTTIAFNLPESAQISIQAFNILGQKAEDIFTGHLTAGEKEISWKPSNLSDGVYLVNIKTPWGSKTKKILFLK